jgi:hypothetical protein
MTYRILAEIVLAFHLAWIVWVITGAYFTRNRSFLAAFHIASLIWGLLVELGPWPCPLTLVEEFFEERAGIDPYHGGFLVHYLDSIVYPNLPESFLIAAGVAVCVVNLLVYVQRLRHWRTER